MDELAGQRVVIMGLGRFGGGVGAARFCVEQGADVLVTDLLDREALAKPLAELDGLPIEYRLGEHNVADFTTADRIVVNPAVDRRDNRFLRAAQAAGVELTSEIRLLVERLPDRRRTIGVTGSAGKSTTCAMIHHILARSPDTTAHLGGNIGGSLLNQLPRISADDWIVLELSSFMLEDLDATRFSPHIALITNFSPNHLDRHGTLEAYQTAKQVILDHQRPDDGDIAIGGPGVHDRFINRVPDFRTVEADDMHVQPTIELLLPGAHNQLNARLAAEAALAAIDQPVRESYAALRDFAGLPHRLQFVAERGGVRCYDDSKSTTPAAAMLAIESFAPQTVHIILGGYDKGSDLTELAHEAAARCAGIYTIGATGPTIADAAEALVSFEGHHVKIERCESLDRAVAAAVAHAHSGQVIVLSPGCASWDQFENYEQRGDRFAQLITSRPA